MNCDPITTIEAAKAELPNSLFPVQGLRRTADGRLTDDAIRTVVDGLKSRGIDPTDKAQKDKLLMDLELMLCKANAQYEFLLQDLARRANAGDVVQNSDEAALMKRKNEMVSDVASISRYLATLEPFDGSSEFIEGWQDTPGRIRYKPFPGIEAFQDKLAAERDALETQNIEKLRRHMVTTTQEKNKHASNYLGLYGFLNFVALGLLIYIAGSSSD